ncbi:MAG: hypothetical protein KGZ83_09395 [Sulfuricella sp.]|nr:hypothetical protein [Sulfuricella sp.]
MNEPEKGPNFVLGNIILSICLIMLFFMGSIWQYLGVGALALWVVLAGVGMYFVMNEKSNPNLPD